MKNILLAMGVMGWAFVATGCDKNESNTGMTPPSTADMTNSMSATNLPATTNTDMVNTNLSANPMTNRPPQ